MRRWILPISPRRAAFGGLLCLILLTGGAITTVAVAWYVSQRHSAVGASLALSDAERFRLWDTYALPLSFPALQDEVTTARTIRFGSTTDAVVMFTFPAPSARNDFVVYESAFGLPCRSMGGVICAKAQLNGPRTEWVVDFIKSPIALGRNPQAVAGKLPVRILWPGFLINTLFYAAIWGGVFFAPGIAKRIIRTKRGRCLRCGYDLRGNRDNGCPECGWGRERL